MNIGILSIRVLRRNTLVFLKNQTGQITKKFCGSDKGYNAPNRRMRTTKALVHRILRHSLNVSLRRFESLQLRLEGTNRYQYKNIIRITGKHINMKLRKLRKSRKKKLFQFNEIKPNKCIIPQGSRINMLSNNSKFNELKLNKIKFNKVPVVSSYENEFKFVNKYLITNKKIVQRSNSEKSSSFRLVGVTVKVNRAFNGCRAKKLKRR